MPTARDGILLFNKPRGLTSYEALGKVKRDIGTRRVGHTGTLDKFAEGLLVVLVGKMTKLVPCFVDCDKTYEGTILFGTETDTLDPEGRVVSESPPPSREKLEAVLPRFHGPIMQAPPAYSALHIDGRRAHELARSGVPVFMKEREITIYDLELLSYDGAYGRIRVHCSKGTYIRSLARDLGLASGSCAHLTELKRTQVATFPLDQATPYTEDLARALRKVEIDDFKRLSCTCFQVGQEDVQALHHGKALQRMNLRTIHIPKEPRSSFAAVFSESLDFIALLEQRSGDWHYGYVYDPS